jgi:hypothetical protein
MRCMFVVPCLSICECILALGGSLYSTEQLNMEGSTPDAELKVELLDLFTLYFMHECGVYSG